MLGVAFHARGISPARARTDLVVCLWNSASWRDKENVNVSFDWGPGELVTTDRMFPYLLLRGRSGIPLSSPSTLMLCLPR
jgi:hypothetical protein